MRPERVQRIPAPFRISRPDRAPQAANDNVSGIGKSVAGLVVRRPLILGAMVAVFALALGWLGRFFA